MFNIYDEHGSGFISTEYIPSILEKLGRNATEGMLLWVSTIVYVCANFECTNLYGDDNG